MHFCKCKKSTLCNLIRFSKQKLILLYWRFWKSLLVMLNFPYRQIPICIHSTEISLQRSDTSLRHDWFKSKCNLFYAPGNLSVVRHSSFSSHIRRGDMGWKLYCDIFRLYLDTWQYHCICKSSQKQFIIGPGDKIKHYKFFNQIPSLMWQYCSNDCWYAEKNISKISFLINNHCKYNDLVGKRKYYNW